MTPGCKAPDTLRDRLHNPPAHPHWSTAIEWRHDRWDPMTNAPVAGYPIMTVRGREADGRIVEPIHYAFGDGDGLMPSFDGWFSPEISGSFVQCHPVEWQPLSATYEAP